ncbi:MAG TPA: hypothetical protein VLF40_05435 [Candidatus Saccharimonadales bacterium]|nr:hypothetical protein [Candidatus Saccharimonadales bacterium]
MAERGALVEVDGELQYDAETAAAFATARSAVEDGLRERGFRVVHSYPDDFAAQEGYEAGEPGRLAFFVNPLRLCSVGLWVRRFGHLGELVTDDDLTHQLARFARPHMPDTELFWDLNLGHGMLIAAANAVSKRVGAQRLMGHAGLSGRLAMVGDTMSDFLGGDVAVHYAVGDAKPEFKRVADYVATAPVTSGAVEILQRLTRGG